MDFESLKDSYTNHIECFGDASKVIYAVGGLMAHHDGVETALKNFYQDAFNYVSSGVLDASEAQELGTMVNCTMNLAYNAHTRVSFVVSSEQYETVLNAT